MKDTLRIKTNQQQPELTKPEVTPVIDNKKSTNKQSPLSFTGGVARLNTAALSNLSHQ